MSDKTPKERPSVPEPQIQEIQPEDSDPGKLPDEIEQIIISTVIGNPKFPAKQDNNSNKQPN